MREPVDICAGGQHRRTVTDARGALVDGSGEGVAYADSQDCSVLLLAPEGSVVILSFVEFDLDPTSNQMMQNPGDRERTTGDYVRLYDGETTDAPRITRLSGTGGDGSAAWASNGNKMLVRFSSDSPMYNRLSPDRENTAEGFKAVWTFSGSGASCDISALGTATMPLPPYALLGECGELPSSAMASGDTCSLRCEENYGLAGDFQDDDRGDVTPTFPYFRDTVVCFDGSLEVRQFTCEKIKPPAGHQYAPASVCNPPAAKLTEPSGAESSGKSFLTSESSTTDYLLFPRQASSPMVPKRRIIPRTWTVACSSRPRRDRLSQSASTRSSKYPTGAPFASSFEEAQSSGCSASAPATASSCTTGPTAMRPSSLPSLATLPATKTQATAKP